MSCPLFRPKMFSPSDRLWYHSRTLGAYVLATVVGASPNGPQFCHVRYIRPGGVTQMDHESAQLSRLEAVVVASPKALHLCAVCLHQWRVPWFALKYLCNPPPGGGDRALRGEIAMGGGVGISRMDPGLMCLSGACCWVGSFLVGFAAYAHSSTTLLWPTCGVVTDAPESSPPSWVSCAMEAEPRNLRL